MRLLAISMGCLCVVLIAAGAQATVLIDNFITPHTPTTLSRTTQGTSSSFQNPTASALGGERDLRLQKTNTNTARVDLEVNPQGEDKLRFSQQSTAQGEATVIWDGVDGSNTIDFDGLGGIDFIMNNDSILRFGVSFNDIAGDIRFTFYSAADPAGGIFARDTINIPALINSETIFEMQFGDFDLTGAATTDEVFSNVGAIQMTIFGTDAQAGRDVDITFLQTVPEPATAGLLGLAALAMLRRRRSA